MDDTRMELLRSWLTKAASDLRSARVLGSAEEAPLDTAIYHCQQTAEKAVKAFLVSKEISPEKTHDIRKLTIEAAAHEPRFNELMDMAAALTPYAWEFRYPDDLAELVGALRKQAEQMIPKFPHLPKAATVGNGVTH